jgi:hypothetical protein
MAAAKHDGNCRGHFGNHGQQPGLRPDGATEADRDDCRKRDEQCLAPVQMDRILRFGDLLVEVGAGAVQPGQADQRTAGDSHQRNVPDGIADRPDRMADLLHQPQRQRR